MLSRGMLAVLLATAVAGFGVAYAIGSSGKSSDARGTTTTGRAATLPTLDAPAGGPTIAAVRDAAALPALRHRPRRPTRTTPTTPHTTTTVPPPTTTVQPPPRTTHTNPPPPPPTITEE